MMYKIICISIFFYLFNTVTYGQHIIDFDFKEKKYVNLNKLKDIKKYDFYQLRITNINTNNYQIIINAQDSIRKNINVTAKIVELVSFANLTGLLASIPPASIITNVIGSKGAENSNIDKNTVNDLLSDKVKERRIGLTEQYAGQIYNGKVLAYSADLSEEMEGFGSKKSKIFILEKTNDKKQQTEAERFMKEAEKKEVEKIDSLFIEYFHNYTEIKHHFYSNMNQLKYIQDTITSLIGKAETYNLVTKLEHLITGKEHLVTKLEQKKSGDIASFITKNKHDITKISKQFEQIRDSVSTFRERTNKQYLDYSLRTDNIRFKLEKIDTVFSHDTIFSKIVEEQNKLLDDLSELVSPQTFIKLLEKRIYIENNEKREYLSMPIQRKEDDHQLKVNILPTDSIGNPQNHQLYLTFPIRPKLSYWSISTGLYFGKLSDEPHSIVPTSDNKFRIVKEDIENFEFGANAMINVGKRMNHSCFKNRPLGYHFTLGGGISITESIRPRLLAGLGISIGEENKLIFNGGIIYGIVDRLSTGYMNNQELEFLPESILVSKKEIGLFLSVQYNFLGTK